MFPKISTFYGPFDWRVDSLMTLSAIVGSFASLSALNFSLVSPVSWSLIATILYAFVGAVYAFKPTNKITQKIGLDWWVVMVMLVPMLAIWMLSAMMFLSGVVSLKELSAMSLGGLFTVAIGGVVAGFAHFIARLIRKFQFASTL